MRSKFYFLPFISKIQSLMCFSNVTHDSDQGKTLLYKYRKAYE